MIHCGFFPHTLFIFCVIISLFTGGVVHEAESSVHVQEVANGVRQREFAVVLFLQCCSLSSVDNALNAALAVSYYAILHPVCVL